ncbi:MAG: hypothetical protein ACO1OB_19155 [Archangium sp.]
MARWLLLLMLSSCAAGRVAMVPEGSYSQRDYLKTAYETLQNADTDTEGHRIRAQLATRAALQALDDGELGRSVPFEGQPSMAVARELLQRVAPMPTDASPVAENTRRALNELNAALGP